MKHLLIFAQRPPPWHGQSVMTEILLLGLGERGHKPQVVDPRISETLAEIGRLQVGKVIRLGLALLRAIRARNRHRLDTLYFIPAPPQRLALLRDALVLLILRPFFPRLILHWHCIGHGTAWPVPGSWERQLSTRIYRGAALSICLSHYSARETAPLASRQTVIIPNGVPDPCPAFDRELWPHRQARAAYLRSGEGIARPVYRVVFLAGRLREKGLFDALEAVRLANRRSQTEGARLRFHLTVAGPFADAAEKRAFDSIRSSGRTELGEEWVEALGWVDEPLKHELLRHVDCLLFPTWYPAESFGLVLVEAMAFGCAVITSRWQAVPEVLPPDYPYLAPVHDPPALARHLAAAATAPASRELRDWYLGHFTRETFLDRMISVL